MLTRAQLIRGRVGKPAELRPPGALPEDRFTETCTRCGDCLKACPTKIIVAGSGGFPVLDFGRGECTFCKACVQVCKPNALLPWPDEEPYGWNLKARIADKCVAYKGVECRICRDTCPVSAIRFQPVAGGIPRPQLNATVCTGCGACVAPCPVAAIAVIFDS